MSSAHEPAVVAVLKSLAEVSEAFVAIAAGLRLLPGELAVSLSCWIRAEERLAEDHYRVGQGTGFRVEWYAEGVHPDGRSLTLGQELSWHEGQWAVDASVRTIDENGVETFVELPRRRTSDVDDLLAQLRAQSQLLLERREEAFRLFSGGDLGHDDVGTERS